MCRSVALVQLIVPIFQLIPQAFSYWKTSSYGISGFCPTKISIYTRSSGALEVTNGTIQHWISWTTVPQSLPQSFIAYELSVFTLLDVQRLLIWVNLQFGYLIEFT